MTRKLQYLTLCLFLVFIAATPLALAAPIKSDLAERVLPRTPIPDPPSASALMDCGGYFDCSCQVCCADSPEPCYQIESSSALQAALSAGCARLLRAMLAILARRQHRYL